MGIEPNEHQIPSFLGKYDYHTNYSENPERRNSPNVPFLSGVIFWGGILRLMNLSVTRGYGKNSGIELEIL
jgi:hypothetical protein